MSSIPQFVFPECPSCLPQFCDLSFLCWGKPWIIFVAFCVGQGGKMRAMWHDWHIFLSHKQDSGFFSTCQWCVSFCIKSHQPTAEQIVISRCCQYGDSMTRRWLEGMSWLLASFFLFSLNFNRFLHRLMMSLLAGSSALNNLASL